MQHQQAGVKGAKFERDRTRKAFEAATKELSAYATGTTPARPDLWAAVGFPLTKDTRTPRPWPSP